MNEFEEKLNSILSDPEEMAKITRLASQLMGNGGEESGEKGGASAPPPEPDGFGFDPGMLGRIQGLMGAMNAKDDGKAGLLKALSPYLREERRAKLQRAMRLAKAAKLAGAMFGGGEGGL